MSEELLKSITIEDRTAIADKMAKALPGIRKALGISCEELAKKAGIRVSHLLDAESGRGTLLWNEYMSLLFVLWSNEVGKGLIEEKGLFPQALKQAMSVNRNVHEP